MIAVLAQLRLAAPLLKWLPLLLILMPALYLSVKLVRDSGRWKKTRPARRRIPLERVWKAFLRRSPATQRRRLGLFQPFIVLGETAAGKSALIERYVDWRGHAEQLQPSHVEDARLQIYRGAHALVEELSPALLEDTSPEASAALRRLFRALPGRRPPRVVIVLDAGRLVRCPPEQITRRAQLMRGKIDLLAEQVRRTVEVTVVVTKADQLGGFVDVAMLLRERGVALRVHPRAGEAVDVAQAFARFESLLPLVQANADAAAYLKALAFFDQLPLLLAPLESFMHTLCSQQSITAAPSVRALALESSDEPGERVWNPFAAGLSDADVRRFHPLRKHVLAAAAIAAATVAWLVAGYSSGRARIEDASRSLETMLDEPTDADAAAQWRNGIDAAQRPLLLPRFFPTDARFGAAELRRRLVIGVRRRLLLPRLAIEGPRRADAIYPLALLYASNRDRLGKLVVAHARQWSDALGVTPSLVSEYVAAADPVALPAADHLPLPVDAAAALDGETPDLARWVAELQRRLAQPFLGVAELQQLQELAARARADARTLAERETLADAAALLKDEDGIDVGLVWLREGRTAGPALPAAVTALASLVEASRLETPDVRGVDLAELSARLGQLVGARAAAPSPAITVTVAGEPIAIDPAAWQRLLLRSRVTLLAHAFEAREDDGVEALFARPAAYPPLTITARGDGCGFGAGVSIDGVYTARAFADHVAPALAALPELIDKLPLAAEDKEQLDDRIESAVQSYADDYAEHYRGLMGALRCQARSPVELRLILAQAQTSGSPLRVALREVARNSGLTLPKDNPFAAPLEAMADELAPLRALAPATGPATQLGAWVQLVRSLSAALDGRAPAPADKEPEDGLRSRLSPLGRVALSIYRGDEDSAKLAVERWLTAANIDTEWWPAFSAPVEEAYALGRRELQKTIADVWRDLEQTHVQPLAESFPFKRDADGAASNASVESALAPKQAFWSTFDAAIAPLLTGARDGWRAREGRASPLLPAALLPTVNRLGDLAALLYDKDGKPKPIVVRVRPLPLPAVRGDAPAAPEVLTAYLQVAGTTIYGFNQRPDWTTLKIEWWKADSASAGVTVAGGGARSYRAVTVMDTPWSFWRLLQRAAGDGHVFTWQVSGPDGRPLPVQFEIKDEPWAKFALR